MATTYKLYYFPVKALGELPRQLFAAANKVFEDIRFDIFNSNKHKKFIINRNVILFRIQPKDWPQFKAGLFD
jgi:hypothetical protein